jgi:hypothetical protein
MMGTETIAERLVVFNVMTRLMTQKGFIKVSGRDSITAYTDESSKTSVTGKVLIGLQAYNLNSRDRIFYGSSQYRI